MRETNGDVIETIEDVWYRFEEFSSATHEFHRARHLIALSSKIDLLEAMHSLSMRQTRLASSAAIEAVVSNFKTFNQAGTLTARAEAFEELANRVSDLASWHPAYDVDRGRIMGVYDDDPEDPSDD